MPTLRSILVAAGAAVSLVMSCGATAAVPAPSNLLLGTDRTEPSVAIDPRNPSIIVVGSNTNYDVPVAGRFPTAVFASHDGGRTFSRGNIPLPAGYLTGADPGISIARSGTVFFSFLAETPSYCSAAGRSAVAVSTSTDGARSFHLPTIVDVNGADDKPNMVAQSYPGRKALVVVTWTRFVGKGSRIFVARSTDGAQTFGPPFMLYSSERDNSGTVPLIGPNHRVYVLWASVGDRGDSHPDRSRIMYRVSTDDGKTFGPPRTIGAEFWSLPRIVEPASLRNLTAPSAAINSSGDLFVSWAQAVRDLGKGRVKADIVVTRSGNGGRGWSHVRRINDSSAGDRFMPALAVLNDGSVGAAFYDRRTGPWDLGVYATRLRFGRHFAASPNVRVNARRSPLGAVMYIPPGSTCLAAGRFFGDYLGAAPGKGTSLLVTWADSQRRVDGQTDLWFAGLQVP